MYFWEWSYESWMWDIANTSRTVNESHAIPFLVHAKIGRTHTMFSLGLPWAKMNDGYD